MSGQESVGEPEDHWPLMLFAYGLAIAWMMVEIHRGVPARKFVLLCVIAVVLTVCVAGLGYHWWPQTEDWP